MVEDGWRAVSLVLRDDGHIALAEETDLFVRKMPPAWTDRDRLTTKRASQVVKGRTTKRLS